jgi:hypothetical protein
MVNKPWSPVSVVCKLRDGGWDRLWIKSISMEGYAPQVSLTREINSIFEKVMVIDALNEVHLVKESPPIRVVFAPDDGLPTVFIATVHIKFGAPRQYDYTRGRDFKVLGCTKMFDDPADVLLNLSWGMNEGRSTIPCKWVESLWFRRRAD